MIAEKGFWKVFGRFWGQFLKDFGLFLQVLRQLPTFDSFFDIQVFFQSKTISH